MSRERPDYQSSILLNQVEYLFKQNFRPLGNVLLHSLLLIYIFTMSFAFIQLSFESTIKISNIQWKPEINPIDYEDRPSIQIHVKALKEDSEIFKVVEKPKTP